MSEAGVDPYSIMEIGGWSSLKILERYLHRTRSERQNAINKLDGVLNSRNIAENANILAIQGVFDTDVARSRQIFGQGSESNYSSEALAVYTQNLRQIDMSECPTEFQLAYLEHIHAWEELARSQHSVNLGSTILSLLQGKLPSIPDEQPLVNRIVETWQEVEKIGLSYGVKAPH